MMSLLPNEMLNDYYHMVPKAIGVTTDRRAVIIIRNQHSTLLNWVLVALRNWS